MQLTRLSYKYGVYDSITQSLLSFTALFLSTLQDKEKSLWLWGLLPNRLASHPLCSGVQQEAL